MESIEFDITEQLDTFNKLANDMPYIISRAMNDTAFDDMRKSFSKEMHRDLNIKNDFIANEQAFRVKRSKKENLTVEVLHKKKEIGLQQFGGVELPKKKKIAIPLRTNMARYGAFARNKALTRDSKMSTRKLFVAERRKNEINGHTVHSTKEGIYLRDKDHLRKIYNFVDKATHSKKPLDFQKVAIDTFNRRFERHLNHWYLKVLTS